jgi:hypothetical protein
MVFTLPNALIKFTGFPQFYFKIYPLFLKIAK